MSEKEKEHYMQVLWAKVLAWESIQQGRKLTGIEKIMAISQCSEFDCKVNLGWPDPSLK